MATKVMAARRLPLRKVHMRSRLFFAATAAALLSLAACSTDTTTAPRRFEPPGPRTDISPDPDGTCRGGYHYATRSDGTGVCEPD
jgi:hypothetical protein